MIFLIDYNRQKGKLKLRAYKDADRNLAQEDRLQLELDYARRGISHEVVILQAASEKALRRTHRRYFEDLKSLAKAAS